MRLHGASFCSETKLSGRSEWVDYSNLFTVLKTIYLWIVYKYLAVSLMAYSWASGGGRGERREVVLPRMQQRL